MPMELSRRCVPYTPVTRKLSEMTIAIVSTAGVHLKDQEPVQHRRRRHLARSSRATSTSDLS